MYKPMLGLSAHTPLSSLTSYEPLINCWALQREASLARAAALTLPSAFFPLPNLTWLHRQSLAQMR